MDQRARLAIDGMLPGDMQKKLEAYEHLYDLENGEAAVFRKDAQIRICAQQDFYQAWMQLPPKWWRKFVLWLNRVPSDICNQQLLTREELATKERESCDRKLEIVRAQVEELALTYQKRENDFRAFGGQQEVFRAYTQMIQENREFRNFFFQNFPEQLKVVDAEGISLIALAKRMLLERVKS